MTIKMTICQRDSVAVVLGCIGGCFLAMVAGCDAGRGPSADHANGAPGGQAVAIQAGGTPGSPSATTTVSGKQLPAPDPKFGGVIEHSAADSKPWWPPRVVPPQKAPNILLIMTDDAGFGVPATFGGVIPTPAMDRIAKTGLRYNNIHSTALCSPTRAALLTGAIITRPASA